MLLLSCLRGDFAAQCRVTAVSGGVWAVTGGSLLGPFDPSMAHPVTDSALCSGRLVRDPDGCWALLAFRNVDAHGAFIGELSDPMPVELTSAGQLQLAGRPQANELICPMRFNPDPS